jgi:large subunit ribosomal protein L30
VAAKGGRLRVKQVKSGIGHAETYRRTLRALGLRHHQQEIVVHDTPSVRGMLHKVRHLVRVTEEA